MLSPQESNNGCRSIEIADNLIKYTLPIIEKIAFMSYRMALPVGKNEQYKS
jgi:hypothetical protein